MSCVPHEPFTSDRKVIDHILFRTEQTRGYESQGSMWSPGYFRMDLEQGQKITFVATTETWDILHSLTPDTAWEAEIGRRETLISQANPAAREGLAGELTLAADQFLIVPRGRTEDAARAHAAGEELRTVIAGYHWFTDWGRDTMISLEGLTLATGRVTEAGWILRTFSQYIKNGLIPNMFPEGQQAGLYHTADATMWFFHALDRYLAVSHDRVEEPHGGVGRVIKTGLLAFGEHVGYQAVFDVLRERAQYPSRFVTRPVGESEPFEADRPCRGPGAREP